MELKTRMFEILNQGGVVMWLLVALSILALGIALERFLTLHRAQRRNREAQTRLPALLLAVAEGRKPESPSLSHSPLGRLLKAGLQRSHHSLEESERTMEAVAGVELRRLHRGMAVLATVANVAPLLGFLGTAAGMMFSFDAIAAHGLTDPGLVAIGIKTALTTTVGGLAVAIPVQLAYNFLTSRIAGLVGDMEHAATLLLGSIADRHRA